MPRIVLVYQCGLANVFRVDRFSRSPDGRNAVRLLQHAFEPCTITAGSMGLAGFRVRTAHCDETGDIAARPWHPGKGEMFRDKRRRVRFD
jgi:hypothetical protein